MLTAVERGWVEDYLRLEPRFRKYHQGLKAAALGSLRQAAVEYAGVFQSGPFAAGVFAQAIWANARSAQAYYGITPAQSNTIGLPAYQPGSGLANTSVGLLWSVDLGPKWLAVGSLESRHLRGDAAHSPLAQRGSNGYVSAGLAYRLGDGGLTARCRCRA